MIHTPFIFRSSCSPSEMWTLPHCTKKEEERQANIASARGAAASVFLPQDAQPVQGEPPIHKMDALGVCSDQVGKPSRCHHLEWEGVLPADQTDEAVDLARRSV